MQAIIVKTSSGKSKTTQKPWQSVTLHDPSTLENADIFLPEGSTINLSIFKKFDKVEALFDARMSYGRIQNELVMLDHVKK